MQERALSATSIMQEEHRKHSNHESDYWNQDLRPRTTAPSNDC
jgi:hypothetical protein